MAYRVELKPAAQRDIRDLERFLQRRILDKVRSLGEEPRPNGVKKLAGQETYRVRVGDFRIIYQISDPSQTVLIARVVDRKDAY